MGLILPLDSYPECDVLYQRFREAIWREKAGFKIGCLFLLKSDFPPAPKICTWISPKEPENTEMNMEKHFYEISGNVIPNTGRGEESRSSEGNFSIHVTARIFSEISSATTQTKKPVRGLHGFYGFR
jgi:hypothetical protein